jgi:hypothetical protein
MTTDKKTMTKTSYLVDTYALYVNVDNSIVKLNPIIEKFGFKFEVINLSDFEKNFSNLVSLPKEFQSDRTISIDDGKYTISEEFYDLIINHHSFGHSMFIKKEITLLKRIDNFEQEVINNTITIDVSMKVYSELKDFNHSLIQQLRLYKNGDVACPIEFQIIANSRKVSFKAWKPTKSHGNIELNLTNEDVSNLYKSFTDKFTTTPLTELAISNYNLSFENADMKTRYVTLMTCLESLMNMGSHQITHTVSRHLSLIISNSVEEFQINYSRTKELYEIRSRIVHGGKINEDLAKATNELHDKVRVALNYCLKLSIDKKQLFAKLNALGFGL